MNNIGALLPTMASGFNLANFGYGDGYYNQLAELARESQEVFEKALTTGQSIVASGDIGGTALRQQWLHGQLERASFEQEDARIFRDLPKMPVYSTAIEWTTQGQYGGPGSGFIPETGSDGSFNGSYGDANFRRRTQKIKYMAEVRQVGLVAQHVKNVANPMDVSRDDATLAMIGKANRAVYWGDSFTSTVEYDGFARQILDVVTEDVSNAPILYDCQGQPLADEHLNEISNIVRNKFGKLSKLYMSFDAYKDTQNLRFPKGRYDEGSRGAAGVDKDVFLGNGGDFRLVKDLLLRKARPLAVDGNGSNGKPRSSSTADSGALSWNATPWSACSAGSAGSGNWWETVTINTSASVVTAPAAVPTSAMSEGNHKNNLAAGSYYYAASLVYDGLEGQCWIFGCTAAAGAAGADTALGGTPTAVAVTAGQIVTNTILAASLTGLGSTYARTRVKVRIYRYGGPSAAAPTKLSQFEFLQETGWPTSSNTTCYDNGMYVPGADAAFGITEKKGKANGAFIAELLPMMERPLPNSLLSDQFGYVGFFAPILWVAKHHIYVRNIGAYNP